MPRTRRVAPPTAQSFTMPVPTGGINTVASGLALPAGDCVQAWNLLAAENGLRVRYGQREWCTGLSGASDNTVRTMVTFSGTTSTHLWAVTSTGLWDVTSSTDTPSQVVTFPSSVGNAGYGIACEVTTAAGHYCLYADEVNGLYRFDESGGTWTKVGFGGGAGQISGVDPSHIVFVMVFKGRVWMVERDTATAWYLPTGAISGTAATFPLGMSFRHGGTLVGLWSWTYDGGAGMDDSLVAWSTGGDVVIYQGTDPASASAFAQKGIWYAAPPPAGRSVATTNGGELLLLTRQGVVPVSRLVIGANVLSASTTIKVANLLNTLMVQRATARGWCMIRHPEDAAFLLVVPKGSGDYALQLAQATASDGWFPWRDIDMASVAAWETQLFFGTSDGRVCVNAGWVDGMTLDDPNAFEPIDWSLLTATSDLGTPAQKQVGLIRPLMLSEGVPPSISVQARYRYSQQELDPVALVSGEGGVWDSGIWDVTTWGGASQPSQLTRGATGMGSEVAIAARGSSESKTVLMALSVTFTQGGFL